MDKNLKLEALKKRAEEAKKESDELRLAFLEKAVAKFKKIKPKMSGQKLVTEILNKVGSPKKRKKLLRTLASGRCINKKILKRKTGSKNVKSLIRDTNKKIKKEFKTKILLIKSCRDRNQKGYYRLQVSHFVEMLSNKN